MFVQFCVFVLLISVPFLFAQQSHIAVLYGANAGEHLIHQVIERHAKSYTKCIELFEKLANQMRPDITEHVGITGDIELILCQTQPLTDLNWNTVLREITANNEWALRHAEQVITAMFDTLPPGVQQLPLAQYYREQAMESVIQGTQQALAYFDVQKNEALNDIEAHVKQLRLIYKEAQANPHRAAHYQSLFEMFDVGACNLIMQTEENLFGLIGELIDSVAKRVRALFKTAQSLVVEEFQIY